MNPVENPQTEAHWEPVTQVVFYEPRTIPAGWDLSEYLPAYIQSGESGRFSFNEDTLNP